MSSALVFRSEAESELQSAFEWYENRRNGLGGDFLLCIEEALDRVRRDPESFPAIYRSVRQVLVRRFPFAIYFTTSPKKIEIIAVFHGSRDPGSLKSRAEGGT
jgi:toxin ParE1/3/4